MFADKGGVEEMERVVLNSDTEIYSMAKGLLDGYFS
jgi:hypothetical protein